MTVYTFTCQSLSLDETGHGFSLFRSRKAMFNHLTTYSIYCRVKSVFYAQNTIDVDGTDGHMVTYVHAMEASPVMSLLSLPGYSPRPPQRRPGFVLLSGAMGLVMTTTVDVKDVGLPVCITQTCNSR